MIEYKCNRCGYNAKQKINLVRHLNRKNICLPLLDDISIENIRKHYGFKTMKKTGNPTTVFDTQTAPFSTQTSKFGCREKAPKQHPNSTQTAPKQHFLAPSKNMCQFCEKTFTRKTGLTKHLKCCKYKKIWNEEKDNKIHFLEKKQEELQDKVEDLLIELTKNGSTINNITNNTNNTTNNQNKIINININNYGNPENHNIKITNKKEPYVKIRKNDKWELQDKKETIATLVDDKYYILVDHYADEEKNDYIPEKTKTVMEQFYDSYIDNKEIQKDLQKKSEMVILNNS